MLLYSVILQGPHVPIRIFPIYVHGCATSISYSALLYTDSILKISHHPFHLTNTAIMSATVDQEPHSSHYSHGAAFSSPCRVEPHPNIVVVDHQAQREKLLTSLRGQTIRIPDLAPLFQHWPSNTSPHIERMRIDIHDWLNR